MSKIPKPDEITLLNHVRKAVLTGDYVILPHARIRCSERDISATDIELVLEKGRRVKSRDRYDENLKRWSYCFEGKTIDKESARIVITFLQKMAIVTVVRLGGSDE